MPFELITLAEAKAQISMDEGFTADDARLTLLIGTVIDWAQNFTQRPLGELLVLATPADADAVPLADPVAPLPVASVFGTVSDIVGGSYDWSTAQWLSFLDSDPRLHDRSVALRRDVKAACLLQLELLYDRNVDNFDLLNVRSHDLLQPYRMGLGV